MKNSLHKQFYSCQIKLDTIKGLNNVQQISFVWRSDQNLVQSKKYAIISDFCIMEEVMTMPLQLQIQRSSKATTLLLFDGDGNQIDRASIQIPSWSFQYKQLILQIGTGKLIIQYRKVYVQQANYDQFKTLRSSNPMFTSFTENKTMVDLKEQIKQLKLQIEDRDLLLNKTKNDRSQLLSQITELFIRIRTLGLKAEKKIKTAVQFFKNMLKNSQEKYKAQIQQIMLSLTDASQTIQNLTGIISDAGLMSQQHKQIIKRKISQTTRQQVNIHQFIKNKNKLLSQELQLVLQNKDQMDQKILQLYLINDQLSKEKEQMGKQLNNLQVQNLELFHGIEDLQKDQSMIKIVKKQLIKKNQHIKKAQKLFQQQINKQKQQYKILLSKMKQLEKNSKQKEQKLNKKINKLECQINEIKNQHQNLYSQINQLQIQKQQKTKQISYIKQLNLKYNQQLQILKITIRKKNKQIKQVQDNFNLLNNKKQKLKIKFQALNKKYQRILFNNQSMNQNIKDLSSNYQTNIQHLKQSYANVNKSINTNYQNSQQLSKIIKQNQILNLQIQNLRKNVIKQQQAHQKAKLSFSIQFKKFQLQSNKHKQQQKLNQMANSKKINKYKNKIIQLQDKISKQNNNNTISQQTFETQIKRLKFNIKSLQQQLGQKGKKIQQNKRQIKELKYLNRNLQIKLIQIQKIKLQNNQLTQKLIKINTQVSSKKNNIIQNQNNKKQEQIRQYKKQINNLKNYNQQLKQKIKAIQINIKNTKNDNNRLTKYVNQLQVQIQSLKRASQIKYYRHQNFDQNFFKKQQHQRQNTQCNYNQKDFLKVQLMYQKALQQKNYQLANLQQKLEQLQQEIYYQKKQAAQIILEKNKIIKQNQVLLCLAAKYKQKQQAQINQENKKESFQQAPFLKKKSFNQILQETKLKCKVLSSEEQSKADQIPKAYQDCKKKYDKCLQQKEDLLIQIQKYKQINLQKDKIISKYQQQKKYLISQMNKQKRKFKEIKEQTKAQISKMEIEKFEEIKKLNRQFIIFQQKIKNQKSSQIISRSSQESPKIIKKPVKIIKQSENQNSQSQRQKNYNIQVFSPKRRIKMEQSQVSVSLESICIPKLGMQTSENLNRLKNHLQQDKVTASQSPRFRKIESREQSSVQNSNKNQKNLKIIVCESKFQSQQIQKQNKQNVGKSDPSPALKDKDSIDKNRKNGYKTQSYLQDYSNIDINQAKAFKLTQSNIFGLQ